MRIRNAVLFVIILIGWASVACSFALGATLCTALAVEYAGKFFGFSPALKVIEKEMWVAMISIAVWLNLTAAPFALRAYLNRIPVCRLVVTDDAATGRTETAADGLALAKSALKDRLLASSHRVGTYFCILMSTV